MFRCLLGSWILMLLTTSALAQVPPLLSFQGRLEDPVGVQMTDPTTLTFSIYDQETGGTLLHSETDVVAPDSRGLFVTTLGDSPADALDPVEFGQQLFVGITPFGESELSPRLPLRAAPYAMRVAFVEEPPVKDFASFYALMPSHNAATIAVGGSLKFPGNGPTSNGGITRISDGTFSLGDAGIYEVSWQASIDEPGQLALALNNVMIAATVVGRATGTSQLVGHTLITAGGGDVLSVVNPPSNAEALTVTPFSGGASPVSATLVIKFLQ